MNTVRTMLQRTPFLACLAASVVVLSACGDASEAGPDDGEADAAGADGSTDEESGCEPGFSGCVQGQRVVCNDSGTAFAVEPCGKDKVCNAGKCTQCATDEHCEAGQACVQGECTTPPLAIVTEALPTAVVGQNYSVKLEATGGKEPYSWKLDQGKLPDGLLVSGDGELKGLAQKVASASIAIAVTDANKETKNRIFVLEVKEGGLVITSSSPLPSAKEGKSYSTQLKAQGGTKPYFWGIKTGKLPAGVSLSADGKFTFDIKALDDSNPTLTATKSFELNVSLAPLEIVGDQEVNLLITKIIVLPLIVVVKGVPVPYSNKLKAIGGKKPYSWSEEPIPGAVKSFLPKSGIPKGLKLGKDGTISGAVTDPTLAAEVKIPVINITLKGFFFAAKVTDSQAKPKTRTALFIIPTAPVNL